jgi:FkbM family methyltransferase
MQNNVLIKLSRQDPPFAPQVMFDVGANKGQTVEEMRAMFPAAHVHTFEPVASTFEMLQQAVEGDPSVTAHQLAFGRVSGVVSMTANAGATSNKIVAAGTARSEDVRIARGDEFCIEQGISHIDLLKIDTEGFDLDVLSGFTGMLRDHAIRMVQVECAISPANRLHVPLDRFLTFLDVFDYGFFGLFDERRKMRGHGRKRGTIFSNAVFIREDPVPQD